MSLPRFGQVQNVRPIIINNTNNDTLKSSLEIGTSVQLSADEYIKSNDEEFIKNGFPSDMRNRIMGLQPVSPDNINPESIQFLPYWGEDNKEEYKKIYKTLKKLISNEGMTGWCQRKKSVSVSDQYSDRTVGVNPEYLRTAANRDGNDDKNNNIMFLALAADNPTTYDFENHLEFMTSENLLAFMATNVLGFAMCHRNKTDNILNIKLTCTNPFAIITDNGQEYRVTKSLPLFFNDIVRFCKIFKINYIDLEAVNAELAGYYEKHGFTKKYESGLIPMRKTIHY